MLPHRVRYDILAPGDEVVGFEELDFASASGGWRVRSDIEAGPPFEVSAHVEWELLPDLSTRVLQVLSRDGQGEEYELELAVTGNGVLAHRVAPDGPSQVELGFGPGVELDYLSAAFSAVLAARSGPGRRSVSTILIGTEDLDLSVVERECENDAAGLLCRTPSTGHEARIEVGPSGELVSYAGLLRLAPTK